MLPAYFNNAATTYPKPHGVIDAVVSCLRAIPCEPGRSGSPAAQDVVSACRSRLSRLFTIEDPKRIVFTSGSTESLNLAIFGLAWEGGSHVVTTSTEHNSVLRPLKTLERDGAIGLSIVPCDPQGLLNPEEILAACSDRTKAVVVNHCSNVTGIPIDLERLSPLVRERGILLIVDASQSAGCFPIDLTRTPVDMLAFTGHKFLYGIPGTGGLYIREGVHPRPLKVGGTGVKSELLFQPEEMPLRYEAGTPNLPGLAALGAGLDFIAQIGIHALRAGTVRHVRAIRDAFKTEERITFHGDPHGSILCLTIEDRSPAEIGYLLEHVFGIVTRSGLHCAPLIHQSLGSFPHGSVRVSPSFFTSDQETERLIDALRNIVDQIR